MRSLQESLVQANIHLLVRVILQRKAVAYRSETLLFPLLEVTVMSTELFRTHDGREIAVTAVCDGGDQGCGGGLLLLMLQAIKRLESGSVLEVRSTDPGVREDLPAWCRMTGHELLAEQEGERHNRYFLRKA
jgi:TusA-related sulfurtransferase